MRRRSWGERTAPVQWPIAAPVRAAAVLALATGLTVAPTLGSPSSIDPAAHADVVHVQDELRRDPSHAGLPARSARANAADHESDSADDGTGGETSGQAHEDVDPLEITLDSLDPAVIPARGAVLMSGTIRNDSDQVWTDINLQPTISVGPLTSRTDLEAAMASDPYGAVAERISDTRALTTVDRLDPGASTSWSLRVPRAVLQDPSVISGASGVYWFGVQALGTDREGRDTLADGRVRTFLPLTAGTRGDVDAALVVPIRREVSLTPHGRLQQIGSWTRDLAVGGRLANVVSFAEGAPAGTLTLAVDPAVVRAAQRLADGNPPRDLGVDPTDEPTDGPSPSDGASDGATADPDAEATDGDGDSTESEDGDEASDTAGDGALAALAQAADRWLADLTAVMEDQQVLALPYGDLDVDGAAEHSPRLIERSLQQSVAVFDSLDIDATPAVAPVNGTISPGALALLDPSTAVLAADSSVSGEAGRADPRVLAVGGREVWLYDTASSRGGPGPNDPERDLAVRQQVMAEAALRRADPAGRRAPVLLALPPEWNPGTPRSDFFTAVGTVPWLRLTTLNGLGDMTAQPADPADLVYRERADDAELTDADFRSARGLIRVGTNLESILSGNSRVDVEILEQALAGVSYFHRNDVVSPTAELDDARRAVTRNFRRLDISTPEYLTMASDSGRLRVDLRNRLDRPVVLSLRAETDDSLAITGPREVELAPNGTTSVPLQITSTSLGVHRVTLYLATPDGVRLGPATTLPVRTSQSSRVIWAIMAVGGGLLFGAILLRLFRRWRGRHDGPETDSDSPEDARD